MLRLSVFVVTCAASKQRTLQNIYLLYWNAMISKHFISHRWQNCSALQLSGFSCEDVVQIYKGTKISLKLWQNYYYTKEHQNSSRNTPKVFWREVPYAISSPIYAVWLWTYSTKQQFQNKTKSRASRHETGTLNYLT